MGCWNGTCGLSQLPITYGTPIRAFLIGVPEIHTYKGNQSGYCYSDGWCYPMTWGIRGEYNDYGGIENIEPTLISELLWGQYEGRQFFETHYDGAKEEVKAETLEAFLNDVVERDLLFDVGHQKTGIGLWMVREDIYQAVLDPSVVKQVLEVETPHYLKAIREELDRAEENSREDLIGPMGDFGFISSGDLHMLKVNVPELEYQFEARWPWMWRMQNTRATHAFQPYRECLKDALRQNNQEVVDTLIREAAEFDAFSGAMTLLRKGWIPQTGKGCQSQEFEYYERLIKGMKAVLKAHKISLTGCA